MENDKAWETMTHEEKQEWLFRQQKDTLDRFLEHGAISKEQYNKSLHDLIEKMGINSYERAAFVLTLHVARHILITR